MNLNLWFRTLVVAVVGAVALTACGGGGGGGGGSAASSSLEVGSDGENLAFDKTALTAPANTEVTVTFKNNSAAQQHNLVVIKGGDDVAAQVDQAGIAAGPPDYLPAGDANVVASTKMLAGGASESVKFTLPAGTYTYICTFPGHYPSMKGTLTVQ